MVQGKSRFGAGMTCGLEHCLASLGLLGLTDHPCSSAPGRQKKDPLAFAFALAREPCSRYSTALLVETKRPSSSG